MIRFTVNKNVKLKTIINYATRRARKNVKCITMTNKETINIFNNPPPKIKSIVNLNVANGSMIRFTIHQSSDRLHSRQNDR